jgi:C1A family cysteine protease
LHITNATLHISTLHLLTPKEKDKSDAFLKIQALGIENYQREVLKNIEERMIQKINNYNKANNLRWTAGKTGVSGYTYSQKKMLLGTKRLPNLAGFEYYKGGIFEIEPPKPSTQPQTFSASKLPSSFDWRNRHGKNWMTEVKQQSCGDCGFFATVGAIEAVTNLYFNQQLNLDLSEEYLMSCYPTECCRGISPDKALKYFVEGGVTTEECLPYQYRKGYSSAKNEFLCTSCEQLRCNDWQSLLVKGEKYEPWLSISTPLTKEDEEKIKITLIEKGPLVAGMNFESGLGQVVAHGVVLVGFDTDPVTNETYWIFKNSYGKDWGEGGYGKKRV